MSPSTHRCETRYYALWFNKFKQAMDKVMQVAVAVPDGISLVFSSTEGYLSLLPALEPHEV